MSQKLNPCSLSLPSHPAVQLRQEGVLVNRKAVARHMQEMGISALVPGPHRPNLSKRAQKQSIYPYLLKGVAADAPNHVWGVDITYIRMVGGYQGWLYLVAVLDWHSRYIVAWELSQNMEQGFVMLAARTALGKARPLIWNSDQGSHFTSPQYTSLLEEAGVRISHTEEGGTWTTSLPRDFGERSNTRKSTCTNILPRRRQGSS